MIEDGFCAENIYDLKFAVEVLETELIKAFDRELDEGIICTITGKEQEYETDRISLLGAGISSMGQITF